MRIKSLVEKHGLRIKESEGHYVIYSPEEKPLEIVS
jgi:hypothetical protein